MKKSKLILIFLCTAMVLLSCSGPEKREKGQRPPVAPRTAFVSTMYDTKPFNIGTGELVPGYTGHNAELLCNSIRLRQEIVKQHPGETAAQHRSRIAGDIHAPLMGSLDFDSIYAFRIAPAKKVYDAGLKKLEVSLSLIPIFEKGIETTRKAFMVRYQPQLDNSYFITGKDGAKKVIEEKKFLEYSIVPVDGAGSPAETRDSISTVVPMTQEELRKTEADVMFLVIGRLQSPYISYEEINKNPQPGASGTYLGRYYYLHIHIVDVWIYDMANGKVLQKNWFKVQSSTKKTGNKNFLPRSAFQLSLVAF